MHVKQIIKNEDIVSKFGSIFTKHVVDRQDKD